ncbi:MAG TPA: glycoside hydrolase family 97 N-terminal domain-containing protein [Bryobacteraceae bacterium]|nr:glycoside hydrolase family 97 N-terminal domain-containing protein [Bryobacteraceae bacterium]
MGVVFLVLALAVAAFAQDPHAVRSPDGAVEFRAFIHQSPDGGLSRIAYQIFYRGKPVIGPSLIGFDIADQEPLLGENDGVTAWSEKGSALVVEYMQNGSIGRRINLEAKAMDEGVAFRFVIPQTTPLIEIPIRDEETEFAIVPNSGVEIAIGEANSGAYPQMNLIRQPDGKLSTRFKTGWESKTPLLIPWRIVAIGNTRSAAESNLRTLQTRVDPASSR